MKVKVALLDGIRAGFLYIMPIEISPWLIQGKDLMVFPCLVSHSKFSKKGIGAKLITAAEKETINQKCKGLATVAYFWGFWFMPAEYFLKLGFEVAERRNQEAILWKKIDIDAEPPYFREKKYKFNSIKGKVIIDLFWNRFCLTSDVETQRVREVVSEYGNDVILNDFSVVDQRVLQQYGIERGIYVNGEPIQLGSEVEKSKLREIINNAFNRFIY